MNRACRIGWALLLACACREPDEIAQTVVWIDAEPLARAMLSRVRVEVTGPMDNQEPAVETRDPDWPIKLVLAPKHGDASRRFKLRVDAYGTADEPLSTLHFASGFVARATRYATLVLHDACLAPGATCGADQACTPWDIAVAADDLSDDARAPRKLGAPCVSMSTTTTDDAGIDAGPATGNASAGRGGAAGSAPVAGNSGPAGACGPGLVQTATGCSVDECLRAPCGAHGRCQNTAGSYTCECDAGYQDHLGTCVVSDNCQVDNGGCETKCQPGVGTVSCSCGKDEWLKADRKTCGGFGAPAPLSNGTSTSAMQPAFAFDGAGNGLAVWIQTEGASSRVWLRRFVAGTGWAANAMQLQPMASGPKTMAPGPGMMMPGAGMMAAGTPSAPSVALDEAGNGVVLWTQLESGDGDVWACRYTAGKACSTPVRIDEDGVGSAYQAVLQIGPDGTGFAAWAQLESAGTRIWANRFTPDKGWLGPEAISMQTEARAMGPRLALDGHGHASLAWMQGLFTQNSARFSPLIARYDPAVKRWHAADELDEDGFAGFPDPQLFGTDGSSVAVWPRVADGEVHMQANRYTPGTGWGHAVEISLGFDITASVVPRLALDANGNGAAVWTELHDSTLSVWSNRYDATQNAWLKSADLSVMPSATPPLPQLAIGPDGDGFAVWSEHRGTARSIRTSRFQAGDGFTSGVILSADTTAESPANSAVQIAVDAHGNAVAIWDVLEAGRYHVVASVFE